MYSKLTQASKRPMTARERFGLILFILKFLISKFGIFILFLSLNVIGNTKIQNTRISPEGAMPSAGLSLLQNSTTHGQASKSWVPDHGTSVSLTPQPQEENSLVSRGEEATQQTYYPNSQNVSEVELCSPETLFSKLKIYCIIATIVTLFLNPQQTKYFGGLAVALKQAGLFSKYGKSEKTVYVFSWIFIVLFAQMSYSSAFLENAISSGVSIAAHPLRVIR